MSTHIPTAGDIAMDLVRCVRFDSFNSENFKTFYSKAVESWKNVVKNEVDELTRKNIEKRLECFLNEKNGNAKRKEDLYTASIFLQKFHIEQMLAGNPRYSR